MSLKEKLKKVKSFFFNREYFGNGIFVDSFFYLHMVGLNSRFDIEKAYENMGILNNIVKIYSEKKGVLIIWSHFLTLGTPKYYKKNPNINSISLNRRIIKNVENIFSSERILKNGYKQSECKKNAFFSIMKLSNDSYKTPPKLHIGYVILNLEKEKGLLFKTIKFLIHCKITNFILSKIGSLIVCYIYMIIRLGKSFLSVIIVPLLMLLSFYYYEILDKINLSFLKIILINIGIYLQSILMLTFILIILFFIFDKIRNYRKRS